MVNFLKKKKAIIFDFDGTLADTVGLWNEIDKLADYKIENFTEFLKLLN